VRTTVDLKPEHHKALLDLAARRGADGVSDLVAEAIERFLRSELDPAARREDLLSLAGSLSKPEADELRQNVKTLRRSWR
jgi:hypothetical protein